MQKTFVKQYCMLYCMYSIAINIACCMFSFYTKNSYLSIEGNDAYCVVLVRLGDWN